MVFKCPILASFGILLIKKKGGKMPPHSSVSLVENLTRFSPVIRVRLELTANGLKGHCSTNWATGSKNINYCLKSGGKITFFVMGYERKTENFSMNLNVCFKSYHLIFYLGHLNNGKDGEYHQFTLDFISWLSGCTIFNFRYRSLGKREGSL